MASSSVTAQQGRGFYRPRFSPGTYWLSRLIGPLYMRLAQGVRALRVNHMERLYREVDRFQRGESRLMIVFRHVSVPDGPVIIKLVSQDLPRWCRAHRKKLHDAPHTHFLYGKPVLNWAGALARWAFPRMGGIPVVNGRVERESQLAIREALARGRFPLAFAPEGQITYHQFETYDLAPGLATLASWARDGADDETRDVTVLPVSLGYSYGRRAPRVLNAALAMLRGAVGVSGECDAVTARDSVDRIVAHLLDLTEVVVGQLERDYPFLRGAADLAGRARGASSDARTGVPGAGSLQRRIDALCERAVRVGEDAVGLPSDGAILDRIFRVRNWIMSGRYREDVDPESLAPLRRDIADRRAALAVAIRPYERLADILEYVHTGYIFGLAPDSDPPRARSAALDRLVEYALNLLDVVNRAGGGDVNTRFQPGGRVARILVGEPIDAGAVLAGSESGREGRRELNRRVRAELERLTRELEERCWETRGSERA
ncbi:MAG: hypothetical protein ACOCXN_08100 [Spirochaetota bacterium]